MATQTFKFENYPLDGYVKSWEESVPERVESVKVPRRDGALQSDGLPDLKRITLRGVLTSPTATGLRTLEDTVISKLRNSTGSSPVGKLRIWDDRHVRAQLDSYSREYTFGHNLKVAEFQAVFAAGTPYWLAETCSTDTRATSSTSLTYSLTGAGTADAPPRITLTAGANGIGANLKITSSAESKYLQYASSMSSGDVLVLDCEALTATINGANALANISGAFFSIIPGANSITYDGTTCSSGTLSFEWQDRWH